MTSEQALQKARALFGEPAVIANTPTKHRCEVGAMVDGRFVRCGRGATWEAALGAAQTAITTPGTNAYRLVTPPPAPPNDSHDGLTLHRKQAPPFLPRTLREETELLGTRAGDYEVVAPLGRGGMGAVYLGRHARGGQLVAMKFLHEELIGDPKLLARFESEARALNLLRHPHIVELLEVATLPNGRPYFVMEYLRGRTLASLVKAPQEPAFALEVLIQVCDALEAAHRAGIVHRDLKAENIFLVQAPDGRPNVKLLDFGIAKLCAPGLATRKTTVGTLIGTPEYMAPEQCAGEEADIRTDVYAVGVVSFLLSTGRLPFAGRPPSEILFAQVTAPVPPPHRLVQTVPPAWSRATLKALSKTRRLRHQRAVELRLELQRVLDDVRGDDSSSISA